MNRAKSGKNSIRATPASLHAHKVARQIKNNPSYWLKFGLLGGIAVITFCCFHYSLGNSFTSWDDVRFITENIFIKSFSAGNLKMMLFHDITGDYYNPVTMLSYAVNYHFSGLAPQAYYLTNIIIHILNSFLLFYLTLMLLDSMEKQGYKSFKWKEWMAFFCAITFAIHPMHVESVSWIAERKDVLYTFFYFAGMMAYLKFSAFNKNRFFWLFLTFIFFLLSLLSKPMAIMFPFSLIMMDVLLKRDQSLSFRKLSMEKLPFMLVTVISVIATYHSEKLSGAAIQHPSGLFHRFLFASYSFFIYVLKAIIPFNLSSYYPYPENSPAGYLPFIYYISPFIALLVAGIPIYLSYQSGKNNSRIVLFGLGFYFFNMVMVSKIIDSGPYFMADRYTYVCYFGIFFPIACGLISLSDKSGLPGNLTTAVMSVFILLFAYLCYDRTLVWHDSETLWTDVIRKYPGRIVEAYNSLGNYYFTHRDIDKAYENYQEAINLKMEDPKVYCNMGILMRAKRQYKAALDYYTISLKLDSNDAITYADRAIVYSILGKYDTAIKDYRHSLRLNPYSEALISNMAFTWLNAKQFDSAINYYGRAIQINPEDPWYFHYRGLAEVEKGDLKPALNDFMQNLQITPHDSESMFYVSVIYNRSGDFNNACRYAQLAQNAKYRIPSDYMAAIKAHLDNR